VTFGQLMAFVREAFPSDPRRNGSVVSQLVKKWGLAETEVLVRGAHLLGWRDLLSLNAQAGIGRRWAHAAWFAAQNKRAAPLPDTVRKTLREMIR
jgi:hypothetical protein